jgi:hypothetical protein
MRNAALVLGIIGGVWAMLVGFLGYGYTELAEVSARHGGGWFDQVQNPRLLRAASFLAPILAIAGGAMARSQNIAAGVLLLLSAAVMWKGYGFHFYTMFPIAFCGLGAILAFAARQPDSH